MKGLRWLAAIVCAAALASTGPAHGATVSLSPAAGSVVVGGQLVIDVIVDGLAAGQSVAGFDIDLVFDAALLSANSVAFGAALGADGVDQLSNAVLGAGRADLAAVSLLSGAELLVLQGGGPFSIATITLMALAPGMADVLFDLVTPPGLLFSDADGVLLTVTVGGEARVAVMPGSVVPEPSAPMLVLVALLLASLTRAAERRRRR